MLKRRGLVVVIAALGALVVAGCYAQTEPASDVGSSSATLNAHGFTNAKQGQAFFQYSTSKNALGTGFGLQTPTLTFPPNVSGPFTAKVSGLSPGSNYWYRVCGSDVGDQPFCNSDLEFTTTVPGAAAAFASPLALGLILVVGDFNGDGVPDLVGAAPFAGSAGVVLGNGDATFRGVGPVDFAGLVGDFNRDGRQDLLGVGATAVEVLPGRGDGTFGASVTTPHVGGAVGNAVVGDFNRDGKPDFAVTMFLSGFDRWVAQVMIGNGNGTFQPPSQTLIAEGGNPASWGGLAARDFNGDGKLDIALGKSFCTVVPSDCGVSVFLGNGNGTVGPEHVYGAGASVFDLAAGTFHGGSIVDFAAQTFSGMTVLNGQGDGTFQVGATYGGPMRGLPVDVNGDGKLDLLGASRSGQAPYATLGNGNGTFRPPIPISSLTTLPCADDLIGDFNGDGKPDYICPTPRQSFMFLNATPPPG